MQSKVREIPCSMSLDKTIPEESVALVHSLEESCVADEDAEVLGEGLSLQSQPHPCPRVADLRLKVKYIKYVYIS